MKLTKKFIPLLLTLCFLLNLVVVPTVAATEAVTPTENWLEGNLEINNAADLMAFSKALADGETFAGQTVTLKANVNLNPDFDGTKYDVADVVNVWEYGGSTSGFMGTFDGENHTISGVYQYAKNGYGGIFGGQVGGGTVEIKNLAIVNSLIWSTNKYTGSIFGYIKQSGGAKTVTLKNLYVDADIYCDYYTNENMGASNGNARVFLGGLVGGQASAENAVSKLAIDSVVYVGDISFSDLVIVERIGGFIGNVNGYNSAPRYAQTEITNSAFYGSINMGTGQYVAGFIGLIEGAAGTASATDDTLYSSISITNSIAAGETNAIYSTSTPVKNVSNILVASNSSAKVTIDGCYTINQQTGTTAWEDTGNVAGTKNGTSTFTTAAELKNVEMNGWTKQTDAFPLPTNMTKASISAVATEADWYTANSSNSTMVISDADDLMDFSLAIAYGKSFSGKTVQLDADIDLNPGFDGTAATLDKVVRPWFWVRNTYAFNGTFDGKGHTISGIYQNATLGYAGIFGGQFATATVTVKDLTIENSYIVSGGQYSGALMGLMNNAGVTVADFDNLDIDVNIHVTYTVADDTDTQMVTGGLIAKAQTNDTVTMDNCVYTGNISFTDPTGVSRVGGLIGEVAPSSTSVTINNSAFYGTITLPGTMGSYLGGLVGLVTAAFTENTVVFDNCVSAGAISAETFGSAKAQIVAGSNGSGVLVMTNCYATEQFVQNGTPLTDIALYSKMAASSVTTGSTIISELPNFKGAQFRTNTEDDSKVDIRFIAVIDTLDHDGVGFEISRPDGTGTKTYFADESGVITTVYSEITGGGKNYTAEALDGKYIVMVIIEGVPADTDVDFTVKPFTVVDGQRVYNESVIVNWDADVEEAPAA